jgi:hypothetical protein
MSPAFGPRTELRLGPRATTALASPMLDGEGVDVLYRNHSPPLERGSLFSYGDQIRLAGTYLLGKGCDEAGNATRGTQ